MITNSINPSECERLEYRTHKFYAKRISKFTAAMCIVNDDVYLEMQVSSRMLIPDNTPHGQNVKMMTAMMAQMKGIEPKMEYIFSAVPIENERYLIHRYLKSIFFYEPSIKVITFKDDFEFKTFCSKYNLEYETQSWFNRVYIEDSHENAIAYLLRNSIRFQNLYFPEGKGYNTAIPSLHDIQMDFRNYQFKTDFFKIYEFFKRNNLRLYHFTDRKNIESIRKCGGLYSNAELRIRGIKPHYASSDESRMNDKRAGLDNYVRLSFVPNHPMLHTALISGRITDPVVIEINPSIALMPNAKYSDRNALKRGARISGDFSNLLNIKTNLFKEGVSYFDLSLDDKSFFQAEVLVEKRIGSEMFLNI